MPEVEPERNLKWHRQCEIRRPSPPSTLRINQPGIGPMMITKLAGYYFHVAWIENIFACVGATMVGGDGREWMITKMFGSRLTRRPMPRPRGGL